MPKKDLDFYYSQLRRIEKHREEKAEKEIRKLYKQMLKELRQFVAEEYYNLAEDGQLTFDILRSKGMDARFLQEVEERLSGLSTRVTREIKQAVEETYRLAYEGLRDAVSKAKDANELQEVLQMPDSNTAQMMWATVDNTTMEIALEKNHKNIVWDVKQAVSTALRNGDRFDTMARSIEDKVNGNYNKAILIARTEVHRVREAGHLESAKGLNNALKESSVDVRMVKKWKTMKDGAVRPQSRYKTKSGWKKGKRRPGAPDHEKMHNVVVELDEPFDLGNGVKAMAPGQSGVAGHDCNCRCTVLYPLMDDEMFFKATGRHFDGYTPEKEKANIKPINEQPKAPESMPVVETKPPSTVAEINRGGTNMLAEAYERHRIKNGLTSVPFDRLGDTQSVVFADYGKMSIESATAFNDTLQSLISEYDTPIQRVRTMTREEFAQLPHAFASVTHDYTVDSAELIINPTKCKDFSKLTDRIKEISENGWCVKIPDEHAERYVATHEFAHTLMNLEQPLRDKTNWLNADYGKIKAARKEIKAVHKEYMLEVERLTKIKDEAELLALTEITDEHWKAAEDAVDALDAVKISDYSLENADEFMAEAFTNEKIGIASNKYSKQVLDILDKYFKG